MAAAIFTRIPNDCPTMPATTTTTPPASGMILYGGVVFVCLIHGLRLRRRQTGGRKAHPT